MKKKILKQYTHPSELIERWLIEHKFKQSWLEVLKNLPAGVHVDTKPYIDAQIKSLEKELVPSPQEED